MNSINRSSRNNNQRWIASILIFFLVVLISACASAPKKAELSVNIEAAAGVNPDLQGRPSPVILHIMQLKSVEQFNGLDYMGIADASTSALGTDLISRNQIILSPGTTRALPMELDPATTHIGLVAGFRDIDNATWRVAAAIDQENHRSVTVRLAETQLSATAQ